VVGVNEYEKHVRPGNLAPEPMRDGFDALREDFAGAFEAIAKQGEAVNRFCTATAEEIDKLWADNAAVRDDLHAIANRLEALTSFVVADPAEVAQKIVTLREAPDA